MTLNISLIGLTLPPVTHTLPAKVCAAFAAATNDPNPAYGPAGIGLPGAFAPPMAVVTVSAMHGVAPVLFYPDLLDDFTQLFNMVHLAEDIRWHVPLRQGAELVCQSGIAAIDTSPFGETLVVQTELRNLGGESQVSCESTLFFKTLPRPTGVRPSRRERAAMQAHADIAQWTVADDQTQRYADASGDANPIHTDDQVARQAGLKGRIVHGLCTMAFAQRAITGHHAAGDPSRMARLGLRFARPVFPGDTLTCVSGDGDGDGELPGHAFVVRNQHNKEVISEGHASLRPPKPT